jgi:hypothetical protein
VLRRMVLFWVHNSSHMMLILTFQWGGNFVAASLVGNDLGVSALLDSGAVQTTASHWALEINEITIIVEIYAQH